MITGMALSVLLSTQTADAGGKGLCRQAHKRDSQAAWTRVLEQAPDAECAEVARTRLDQLSTDLRDCSVARRADTLEAWHTYSMSHPTGECGLEAVTQIKMREARGEERAPEPEPEPIRKPIGPPAHVEVEVSSAEGAFDAPAVRVMFGPGQMTLLGCYLDSPAKDQAVDLPVTIEVAAGAVSDGAEATSEVEGLGACVVERLGELDWPTAEESTAVALVIRYTPLE